MIKAELVNDMGFEKTVVLLMCDKLYAKQIAISFH